MAIFQGYVGPITKSADNTLPAGTRLGQQNDLIVSELHGQYYEQTVRKNRFTIANQAGVTTSVGLATTYVGLCIANPTTSQVNVIVNNVAYAFSVAPAASVVVGLMTGTGASITGAVTPRNRYVTGSAPNCLASTSLVLPGTPVLETVLGVIDTGALTTGSIQAMTIFDLKGGIVLPPGTFLCFYTSTASGASGFLGSIDFEEAPTL